MAEKPDKKTSILDSAIRLMSERGIKGVSVRQIQDEAGVNLALAYHHFGNREGLLEAVMGRAARGLLGDWEKTLREYERPSMPRPQPEKVLEDLFRPVVFLSSLDPQSASLLGQLLVSPDPKLEALGVSLFNDYFARFGRVLRKSLPPGVDEPHLQVRLDLMTGSLIILLTRAKPNASTAPEAAKLGEEMALLMETVEFCLAGLTAP